MPLRNLTTAWLTIAMLGSTAAWADAQTDATLAEGRKASQLFLQLGTKQTILTETTSEQAGARIYLRTSRWSKAPMPIAMQWAFATSNQIAGFYVRTAPPPIAESPYKDYQTKATLRPPFEGEWLVVWGGCTQEQMPYRLSRSAVYIPPA